MNSAHQAMITLSFFDREIRILIEAPKVESPVHFVAGHGSLTARWSGSSVAHPPRVTTRRKEK